MHMCLYQPAVGLSQRNAHGCSRGLYVLAVYWHSVVPRTCLTRTQVLETPSFPLRPRPWQALPTAVLVVGPPIQRGVITTSA